MSSLFTTESRKAWVAGLLTALLNPVLTLLSGTNVLTVRTLVVAVISGILGAVAVWATDNADPASPVAGATAPATGAQTVIEPPVRVANDPTPTDLTDNFPGQSVLGE